MTDAAYDTADAQDAASAAPAPGDGLAPPTYDGIRSLNLQTPPLWAFDPSGGDPPSTGDPLKDSLTKAFYYHIGLANPSNAKPDPPIDLVTRLRRARYRMIFPGIAPKSKLTPPSKLCIRRWG